MFSSWLVETDASNRPILRLLEFKFGIAAVNFSVLRKSYHNRPLAKVLFATDGTEKKESHLQVMAKA